MKKYLLLCLVLLLALTGCSKQKENEDGAWEKQNPKQNYIEKDALDAFNKAKENYSGKLKSITLLGKQVVSGTNYMFLCEGDENYKVVIVYKDLNNKVSITKETDFDITKYVNKDIDFEKTNATGAWDVVVPKKLNKIDDKVQTSFDDATKELTGITYKPIAVLANQIVSGTNYAVLCYGTLSTKDNNKGIFLITLYKDLHDTSKIISSSYINLSDFNK